MEKGSVSIHFVKAALDGVRRRGLATEPFLQAAGIAPGLLHASAARVSAESYGRLWLDIAAALDDELFGIDSRRMKVGSFAGLSRSALSGRTLGQALDIVLRLLRLLIDETRPSLECDDDSARLVLEPLPVAAGASPGVRSFAHETLLIMLHGLMCWLIGRRIPVAHAAFAYPRPAHWREYTLMFAQGLSFDEPRTRIEFDAAYLAAPVTQNDKTLPRFLREAPSNIILKYKDANSWSARVRRRLRSAPPAAWPSFAGLAAELGLANSTLHRRLLQEGASFRGIKDALRRDLAIDRLSHSSVPIEEIAQAMGFAETSAFHRAFKQWTGVRPGEYRRRLTHEAGT